MGGITRRGAIVLGIGAAMTAATHALAAQNPYEGQTGTLVIRNDVDMGLAVEESPAFMFHITVWDYFGALYLSEDFQLKGGDERVLELPAAYSYEVTQDEMENYLWSCDGNSQTWHWWVIPGGTRYILSRNGRIHTELMINISMEDEVRSMPFRIQVWDLSGEQWRDEVYAMERQWESVAEIPVGYTYRVTYTGDAYCHLTIENGEGIVGKDGPVIVTVRYTPHGHIKVRKDVDI